MNFLKFNINLNKGLLSFFLITFLIITPSYAKTLSPQGIFNTAFFLRDIDQIAGELIQFPLAKNIKEISQKFTSSCANLNRIILPFWTKNDFSKNELNFILQDETGQTIFSAVISPKSWPLQKKIGTHSKKGILHYIWFSPQKDSKNKTFQWILTQKNPINSSIGIFLTKRKQSRIETIKINKKVIGKKFSAFYSYCQFKMNGKEILSTIWQRIIREEFFLGIYIIVLSTIGFYAFKKR